MNCDDVAYETTTRRELPGFVLLVSSVVIALAVIVPGIPIAAMGGGDTATLVFSLMAIALASFVLFSSLRGLQADPTQRWIRVAAAGISGLSLVPATSYLGIAVLRLVV